MTKQKTLTPQCHQGRKQKQKINTPHCHQGRKPVPVVTPREPKPKKIDAGEHCKAMKQTGHPCTAVVQPFTKYCGTHQPKIPKVDPICMAPVAKTGKRCTHKRQGESRWCGNHFNAWHGQEDPDL